VKIKTEKQIHLEWLLKSRAANQKYALKLFNLIEAHPTLIKGDRFLVFVQGLVGITFSLWRAAFLADRTGHKEARLKAAKGFLETIITDNAIAFLQDKTHREWTFTYYMNNVRFALDALRKQSKNSHLVPEWKFKGGNARVWWEQGQSLLEHVIDNFEKELQTIAEEVPSSDE
jgi:hypothetical protein